jgi:hypothetical protein
MFETWFMQKEGYRNYYSLSKKIKKSNIIV